MVSTEAIRNESWWARNQKVIEYLGEGGYPVVVDIDEKDLKSGVLGLIVALVEVVTETLRLAAVRRMEGGDLAEAEVERLGIALMDLDAAIDEIKQEMGLEQSVKAVRNGLDDVVQGIIDSLAPIHDTQSAQGGD